MNTRVVHLVFEDISRDFDGLILGFADDRVALVLDRLVIISSREPVIDCELGMVPLWRIFVIFLFLGSLGSLLQSIFDVLEDNVIDGSVINLSEFVSACRCKIDYQTASKIVLDLNHVADHLAVGASDEFLGEFGELCRVSELALSSFHEDVSCVFFSWLLAESNSEDVILHGLKELSQTSHAHADFLLVMTAAIHALKDILGHIEQGTE